MKSQITIGKKVVLLAASLVGISVLLGAAFLVNLSRINGAVVTLVTGTLPGVDQIGNISAEMYRFRGDAWKHIASISPEQMAAIEAEMSTLKSELAKSMAAYQRTITMSDDRENFRMLEREVESYLQAWQTVLPVSRTGANDAAYARYVADADPLFRQVRERLSAMQQWNTSYGNQTATSARQTTAFVRVFASVGLAASVLIGFVLSWFLIRGVNAALQQAVSELSDSAAQVASAARQVSSSSQSLAQGASEQAASLEETSASTEEINSMARKSSELSRTAAGVVTESGQKFVETNQSLSAMVAAMEDIDAQSGKISRIIKVIDEIAFQTNILALNAAVEAARAGEAGMGFAVVADEVRNLAQRSAQAARETAALIEESITKSTAGKEKVGEVAAAMQTITAHVSQVKTLVEEVSVGSDQQASGIDQIGRAIAQMEQITQTNAANAEESAAAAEELNAQSDALEGTVARLAAMIGGEAQRTTGHPRPGKAVSARARRLETLAGSKDRHAIRG